MSHFEIATLADVEVGVLKIDNFVITNLTVELVMTGHFEIENFAELSTLLG
jgi:hypothetical protein